jgi:acyl-CoA synthetase (AMP-forming)/AMP-acid ligase II
VPVIPINPKSGSSELAHVVADADPDAIALAPGSEAPAAFDGRRRVVVNLGAGGSDGAAGANGDREPGAGRGDRDPGAERELSEDDPALIVYTSGTTGSPKGAVMPRRAISSNLDSLAEVWEWTERDVVTHALPLFHAHGLVVGILGPVRRGGGAVHLGRFSPEAVQRALSGPATMLFGVPTMYRRLADADEETIGEIQVRGPNLFLGYLNRDDATTKAMRDGWFATGDLATRTAQGYIRIVGRRATDLIKSGGDKIGAGEIEGCLREHPAVEDAAVTGEPDGDLGERVVAWVVLKTDTDTGESELIDHVAAELAPHKRPRVVRFLDELPRNELGKVQKPRLTSE